MIYYVARVAISLASAVLLYVSYSIGGEWGVQYFGIDVWFFRLAWSLCGVMALLRLFSWLNHFLMFYVKHTMIYALAQKEPTTFWGSFFGLLKRGKTYLSVVVLDSILRKAMGQVFSKLTEEEVPVTETKTEETKTEEQAATEATTETTTTETTTEVLTELRKALAETPNFFLFRKAKAVTITTLEYVDECILAYCYANPDVRLLDATLIAFKLFFKNAADLLKQVLKVTTTHALLRGLIVVVFWVAVFYYKLLAYFSFVQLIVGCYTITMVVDISFLEPLLMKTIVTTFLKYVEEVEAKEKEEKEKESESEGDKEDGGTGKKKKKKPVSKLSKEERDKILQKLIQLSPLFKKLKSSLL